jgi:hypothetical protein
MIFEIAITRREVFYHVFSASSASGCVVPFDVPRTHPQVIVGGILRANPNYMRPDELLRELDDRGALAH